MMFLTELIGKVGHLTPFDDVVLVGIPLIVYLVKAVFKPTKIEAEVLTKLFIPVILALLRTLAKYQKEHPNHADSAKQELIALRNKLGRKAIG